METNKLSTFLVNHPNMVMYWDLDPLYSGVMAKQTATPAELKNLRLLKEKVEDFKGCTSRFFSFWTEASNAVRRFFKFEVISTDDQKIEALAQKLQSLINGVWAGEPKKVLEKPERLAWLKANHPKEALDLGSEIDSDYKIWYGMADRDDIPALWDGEKSNRERIASAQRQYRAILISHWSKLVEMDQNSGART